MSIAMLETAPAAILVGAEAFFVSYGVVWATLWHRVPSEVLIGVSVAFGALAAAASAAALVRSARRAAQSATALASAPQADGRARVEPPRG